MIERNKPGPLTQEDRGWKLANRCGASRGNGSIKAKRVKPILTPARKPAKLPTIGGVQ